MAALVWLVRVNVNVLSQDETVARCLQEAKVRVFHMDSSRTERVHLTGQFPPSDTRPSNGILPVFNGFVTVDVKPRDGESCPGYYDIFGLFSRDHDVPDMTMAEGVARGWLDARFCRADSESLQSVFLFFGNNHYDALLPCPKNPVSITRTSTGGDVISHRLNGGKSPPVVLHLLPMALTCFLEKDTDGQQTEWSSTLDSIPEGIDKPEGKWENEQEVIDRLWERMEWFFLKVMQKKYEELPSTILTNL